MSNFRTLLATLSAFLVASCAADRTSGLTSSPPDQGLARATSAVAAAPSAAATPTFLQPALGAPAIANPVITFWAVKGRESQVTMMYLPLPGATDSTLFLRFRVRKKSLAFFPGGQPIAVGDSVQITITLVDPVAGIVQFQPAGLVFSRSDPADLKISYFEADHDFNHDGVIDKRDARIERSLTIWKLHPPNPWTALKSVRSLALDEVETDIFDFTSYAIAY